MNADRKKIGDCKKLILGVLNGDMSPHEQPWLIEDDLIYLAVATLKKIDPTWLSRQLQNNVFSEEAQLIITQEWFGKDEN